jgi:hypothetical protein
MPDRTGYYLQFPTSYTEEQIRRRFVERFGIQPQEIYTHLTKSGQPHSKMAGPVPDGCEQWPEYPAQQLVNMEKK